MRREVLQTELMKCQILHADEKLVALRESGEGKARHAYAAFDAGVDLLACSPVKCGVFWMNLSSNL